MTLEHWLAFVAASTILLMIPGPTILLVISHALSRGRHAAGASVAGVVLGDFTAMTASLLGLGALLAASASAFMVLKWIGAAYLVYLGIRLWRSPVAQEQTETPDNPSPKRGSFPVFLHTYTVTALNPKSIVFFIAFLPQFLVSGQPLLAQMAILEATFLVLAAINAAAFALLAAAAREKIKRPRTQRLFNRTGGSLLIGAGLLAAGWKRVTE
ncbi:LysE family translocator [Fodinicurvata fenggangensis]|uniref:LysE family translocator n=1 Tax=Fodinicurvata fenggangensis TaxID=1121830 RepID=UPI00047BD465|nr:LysE family translocator [Fodinicurvata fenggangensis]